MTLLGEQPIPANEGRKLVFSVNVEKKPHPTGDRVVVTFDGKFLPYDWSAAES
jgi:cyanate lyase